MYSWHRVQEQILRVHTVAAAAPHLETEGHQSRNTSKDKKIPMFHSVDRKRVPVDPGRQANVQKDNNSISWNDKYCPYCNAALFSASLQTSIVLVA